MKGKAQKNVVDSLLQQKHNTSSTSRLHMSPSSGSNEEARISNPQPLPSNESALPSNEGSSAESAHNLESEGNADSNGRSKRKGRGKAKGVTVRHGLEVKIYQGRIVTPQVVRQISIIFYQCLTGPWISFTEYPKEEFEILFARFKEVQFACTYTEEELKAAVYRTVQIGYSKWMFQLRDRIFKKYSSVGDRKKNCPCNLPPPVWMAMVDKWMTQEWQDKSTRNKNNNKGVDMYHTAGSVSIAKYKCEQMEQTGKEPNPIECFKKFHVRKNSEVWTHEKAEELYKQMETKITNGRSEGSEVDEWEVYRETVGKPSHGRILGMGTGVKAKDVYGSSSDEGSSKRARVDKTEELELKMKTMNEELQQLRELVTSMLSNSQAQVPPPTANISANENVEQSNHAPDEQLDEDMENSNW